MRFPTRNILTLTLALVIAPSVTHGTPACALPAAGGQSSQAAVFASSVQNLIGFLQTTAANNPNQQALVNDLQAQFNGLTADQVSLMAANYNVNAFSGAISSLISAQPSDRVQPPADPPANLFQPNFSICTLVEGKSFAGVIQVPSDPAIVGPLQTAIEIAQTAKDIGDRLCDLIVVALGGTNAPGCIVAEVTDLILDGLQKAKDILTFCDPPVKTAEVEAAWQNTMVIDSDLANHDTNVTTRLVNLANQLTQVDSDIINHTSTTNTDVDARVAAIDLDLNNHITAIDADLNNHITGIDTDLNTHLTSVDSDVTTRDTQIDTEISTFQTLNLRLKIEAALSAGQVIGLFEIPTTQGGYLDLVRSIVVDTINKVLASGGTVGTASKNLSTGDTAKAAGQFKNAYGSYASAYQAAIH